LRFLGATAGKGVAGKKVQETPMKWAFVAV
jgi:hypothetical protein